MLMLSSVNCWSAGASITGKVAHLSIQEDGMIVILAYQQGESYPECLYGTGYGAFVLDRADNIEAFNNFYSLLLSATAMNAEVTVGIKDASTCNGVSTINYTTNNSY